MKTNFFNLLKINGMKIKKSKKANLEKKRGIYFQIGLVVSLSLVLLAFEWTTVESGKIDLIFNRDILIEDDLSEITIHKKKPEMPKPKIVQPIEVPDDTEMDDENFEIDAEVTEDTKNDLNIQPEYEYVEEVEETAIFKVVEKMPEFPGGVRAMQEFLSSHIKYPYDAKKLGIVGIVYISFIVWKDGSIRDVKVKRGIGGGCDEEAVRVVKSMPVWNPGFQRNIPVNVECILPVKFKLN